VVSVLLRDLNVAGWATTRTATTFAKLIWKIASPKWNFDDATFERSAAAFSNPDHVDIVTTIIAGGKGSPLAKPSMTISAATRSDAGDRRSHHYARRRMRMAHPTRPPRLTPSYSLVNMTSAHHRRHRTQPAADAPQAFAQAVVDVNRF
jgi:hypothetical protein